MAGLVKMAMKSHHVLLQHYCIIINKHYPLYAITILWPQVKEASTRIQTYANNEAITAICENRTVCKDLNIHHTSVNLKIMIKLEKIKKLYRKTLQKESEPFDVLVKNIKSRTTAKVFVLHRTNQQAS